MWLVLRILTQAHPLREFQQAMITTYGQQKMSSSIAEGLEVYVIQRVVVQTLPKLEKRDFAQVLPSKLMIDYNLVKSRKQGLL